LRSCGSARALAVLLAALAAGCDPSSWKAAEGQVRDALAAARPARLDGLPRGAVLELAAVRHFEPAITVDGGRAAVAAMVDAAGRVEVGGASIDLRYLGRERFHLRRCAEGWCAEEDELARLRGVVAALLGRAEGADRATAWQIRVERDHAEVGEDRVSPAGAVSRALLRLEPDGGAWAIAAPR
jgi:hypothetical protein